MCIQGIGICVSVVDCQYQVRGHHRIGIVWQLAMRSAMFLIYKGRRLALYKCLFATFRDALC